MGSKKIDHLTKLEPHVLGPSDKQFCLQTSLEESFADEDYIFALSLECQLTFGSSIDEIRMRCCLNVMVQISWLFLDSAMFVHSKSKDQNVQNATSPWIRFWDCASAWDSSALLPCLVVRKSVDKGTRLCAPISCHCSENRGLQGQIEQPSVLVRFEIFRLVLTWHRRLVDSPAKNDIVLWFEQ